MTESKWHTNQNDATMNKIKSKVKPATLLQDACTDQKTAGDPVQLNLWTTTQVTTFPISMMVNALFYPEADEADEADGRTADATVVSEQANEQAATNTQGQTPSEQMRLEPACIRERRA